MLFRRILSFLLLSAVKLFTQLFYRMHVTWIGNPLISREDWNEVRLIVFLNHTSLFEPLFIDVAPSHFLWRLPKRLVAPAADKTFNRPLVGKFWKFLAPGMTSITRKRDGSWQNFVDSIQGDKIVIIAAEGRMKRSTGLDLRGNKMTVRLGVAEVLRELKEGKVLFAYSGGLHHVQKPGQGLPNVFKNVTMNLEAIDINKYKSHFQSDGKAWLKDVVDDMQKKLESNCPSQGDQLK